VKSVARGDGKTKKHHLKIFIGIIPATTGEFGLTVNIAVAMSVEEENFGVSGES